MSSILPRSNHYGNPFCKGSLESETRRSERAAWRVHFQAACAIIPILSRWLQFSASCGSQTSGSEMTVSARYLAVVLRLYDLHEINSFMKIINEFPFKTACNKNSFWVVFKPNILCCNYAVFKIKKMYKYTYK